MLPPIPVLQTNRFKLRPFEDTEKDLAGIFSLIGDIEVVRHTFITCRRNLAESYSYLQDLLKGLNDLSAWHWAIEEGAIFLGLISVMEDYKDRSMYEVGFMMVREHWRKGVMKEVLPKVLQTVFETASCNKITANCFSENTASLELLLKHNFWIKGSRSMLCQVAKLKTNPLEIYPYYLHGDIKNYSITHEEREMINFVLTKEDFEKYYLKNM